MAKLLSLVSLVAFGLSSTHIASAVTVGPVGDMVITDGDVTPDGFTRAAVLVNGQVPGPIVVGNKVGFSCLSSIPASCSNYNLCRATTSSSM